MKTRRKRPWHERFDEKWRTSPTGCFLWMGALNSNGYGVFYLDGRMQYAHRVAFSSMNGEATEKTEIDHLCRTRNCVNPDHMEIVTHRENTLRGDTVSGRSARKTSCIRGHELPIANRKGRRRCKPCAALAEANRPARDWSKVKRNK
jgi:hypothetical protein